MIKPNTSFKSICSFGVYPEDAKVLSLLYQPLIGAEALGLYMMLSSLKGTALTHHFLIQLQNFSMEQFLQCRHKLEGVGLMSTYQMDGGNYTYELRQPLTPARFFSDGIINAFLCVKIGNADYQQLRQLFVAPPLDDRGQDIGKSFNEVFDTTSLMTSNVMIGINPLPGQEPTQGINLQYAFDHEVLGAILRQKHVSDGILSEKLLAEINKIAFLYKLDEHELARLIIDGLDGDNFIHMDTIRKNAKQYWQFLNKGKPLQVTLVEPNAPQKAETKEERLLRFYAQNPLDFLKAKSGGAEPVPADRTLVEWLYVDQGMLSGVVNVLLDYVLKISDGRLPKPLVEKIAGEWQRKKIDSVDKAIKQVRTVLKGNKERAQKQKIPAATRFASGGRAIRQEPVPEWLNQPTASENVAMTAEDQKKIQQMKELQQQILNTGHL
ncbi:MAG: DnaD domain protein [Turicibacter sp.]|nr:DnaD domain protein [Turicibacter sp.]